MILDRAALDFQLLKLMAKEVPEGAKQLLDLTFVVGDPENLEIVLKNSLFLLEIENPETLRIAAFESERVDQPEQGQLFFDKPDEV